MPRLNHNHFWTISYNQAFCFIILMRTKEDSRQSVFARTSIYDYKFLGGRPVKCKKIGRLF